MNGAVAVALLAGLGGLLASRLQAWLSPGGMFTSAAVGLLVLAGGGAAPCLLLVFFFATSSLLTRFREDRKRPEGRGLGPGSPDDPGPTGLRASPQVLANAGAVVVLSAGNLVLPLPWAACALTGAIAAATADSWATEIGTGVRGSTRRINTLRPVEPGCSGGVSIAGTLAAVAGTASIGLLASGARALSPGLFAPAAIVRSAPALADVSPPSVLLAAATAGGLAGVLVDSLLGASLEGRWRLVNNETINLACTVTGALVGAWMSGSW